MVFSKRATPGNDISCIIWKDGIFSPKTWYFFPGLEVRDDLSQEIHGNRYFLCTRTSVTNVVSRPSAKKNQRLSYPAKIHLKVIDVLGWHPRKSSSNSLYFHGDLYGRFHVLLSGKKKTTKNLIYRIEVRLLLQFIRLEIFYNE